MFYLRHFASFCLLVMFRNLICVFQSHKPQWRHDSYPLGNNSIAFKKKNRLCRICSQDWQVLLYSNILPPYCFEMATDWQLQRHKKWLNQTNCGNDTLTSNRLRQRAELQTEPSCLISVGSSRHCSLIKLSPKSAAWRGYSGFLITGCRSRG